MRTIVLVAALFTLIYSYVAAYQISLEPSSITNDHNSFEEFHRAKRQLENFDDEYPTSESQREEEQPGFWDRIVKVALKLFSKFIEWLNT